VDTSISCLEVSRLARHYSPELVNTSRYHSQNVLTAVVLIDWESSMPALGFQTVSRKTLLGSLPCHSSVVMKKARAKPKVVTSPTCLPPYLNASGIMVSASMVNRAPPAKACTKAIVAGEAPSKKA
jgi:hypothetical protein